MGLLPCLRRGSDRWWLPLSALATESIGLVMLARGRGRLDPGTRSRLLQTLRLDPPLLIFAALCWSREQASLEDLADWLTDHALGRFASGDAFLGVPAIEAGHHQHWNKLRDYYRTLPIENWLDQAPLWLEVTGPTVSDSWKRQWPSISAAQDNAAAQDKAAAQDNAREIGSAASLLQQLACMIQRQQALSESFDRRVSKAKQGALKQLAYGLSHEINNPLANISTRAQQLQRGEEDPTRSAILQRIVDQVYRAHGMIADLMFFAHPPAVNGHACDLNEIIGRVANQFQDEAARQAIRLEVKTFDQPATACVDEAMMGEAIRALIRNSIDAIGCEGTIVVSLERDISLERDVSLERDRARWMIHVADSGAGLSEDAREHAFDPYFSGREAGRGLGLGLCRAYRIAKLHHGEITLAGGPTGCVATIAIPCSD